MTNSLDESNLTNENTGNYSNAHEEAESSSGAPSTSAHSRSSDADFVEELFVDMEDDTVSFGTSSTGKNATGK